MVVILKVSNGIFIILMVLRGIFYHFGGFMGYSIILMVYRHLDDFGNLKVTLVILKALRVFWLFKRFYRHFYHFRSLHYILFILEAFYFLNKMIEFFRGF